MFTRTCCANVCTVALPIIVALGTVRLAADDALSAGDRAQAPPTAEKPKDAKGKPATSKPAPSKKKGAVPRQPAPEDILRAFRRDRPDQKPIRPRGASAPAAGAAKTPGHLLREGDYISDLAARLSKEGNWWRLEFESDSPEAPRPPMRVLPSQLLELMVRESEVAPYATYTVSGEVTLFESRNYILLRRVFRRADTDNLSK